VPMKTIRVWCPCPTWEECPVTCYQRVCECRPVKIKVCCYHREVRQVPCQVTCWKCVPEQRTETYQVMVMRKVPCQATPCVSACGGCQGCASAPCCQTTCCCTSCASSCCCRRKDWFHRCSGLHFRHEGCCD
jgi:hypothetical protein